MTTTRHPDEGTLRRLLDEPGGVADAERQHVDACETCAAELAVIRDDAEVVRAALVAGIDDVDLDAAWQRLTSAGERDGSNVIAIRPRRTFRRPVAAAVVVGAVLAGGSVAAANDWLPIFRAEEVAPVAFDIGALNAVPDLADYGDLDIEGEPDVRVVADAAEAEAETGLEVPVVDELPRGVSGEPTYRAGREVVATFTYDADRAGDDSAPPGVDGSSIRLVAGPGVAAAWRASSGAPAMIVGRAIAPSAESTSGVPFEVLRDHLLALPAVPDDVAASLRTFNDSTLPLPVPEDRFRTSSADVGGATATVVESIDRTIAAVVWVHEGIAHVVAGSLDVDEVLDVARGLR